MRILSLLFLTVFFCYTGWASDIPKQEIRAVWLTTIYGLDWPSKPATTEAGIKQQQKELRDILDKLQDANFNTVFLQVRMRGDVIYRSAFEPASRIFSGKQGTLPGYDPLAFAIEECHKRGMECHAWFVTFPLGTDKSVKQQGNLSVVKRHPHLCKLHRGEWYLDPGVPETKTYLLSLVRELVNGYNIDGIHFDYIRYPEQANRFPDKATHSKYGKNKKLADWRRENINDLVTAIYDCVKEDKPWVQVSSSPLGKYNRIERVPNAGWTAYESVFQDPKLWMEEGKHDMVVPMMYYLHDNFFPFVDNWVENGNGRLIVPGLGAYRMDKKEGDWNLSDITDQIDYSRYYGASGCAFFRCAHITNNYKGIYDQLKDSYYKYPATLPPLTWLSVSIPETPEEIVVERIENELKLSWKELPSDSVSHYTYTVYYSYSDTVSTEHSKNILMTGIRGSEIYLPVPKDREMELTFCLTASDRYHNESCPSRETYYYLSNYEK